MSRQALRSVALVLPLLPCAAASAQGELDPAFGSSGKVFTDTGDSHRVRASAIQPDGKILVAGFLESGGAGDLFANRYHPDGSLDAGFGAGGISVVDPPGSDTFDPIDAALQADGKVVVVGVLMDATFNRRFAALRLNADGALDVGFGAAGLVVTELEAGSTKELATAVAIQPDGRIVVGGWRESSGFYEVFAVVRYLSDGTLDTSFGTGGKVLTDIGPALGSTCHDVAVLPGGGIVAAGESAASGFVVVRHEPDGTLTSSFGVGGIATASIGHWVNAPEMAVQDDGKIVIGGTSWNGSDYDLALARFHVDGSLDASFDGDGLVASDSLSVLEAMALQPDGKIITVGGSSAEVVARFDTSGALDPTFGDGGTATVAFGPGYTDAGTVAIQSDGKLVVATAYTDAEGLPQSCALARLVGQVWEDAGAGLAGAEGTPQQVGNGSLLPGTPVGFSLANAAPTSPAVLVFGASRLDLPFLGGTMVPSLDVLVGVVTDTDGEAVTSATWPSGPSAGTPYYTQYWILDATGPQGATASNALIGVAQ